MLHLSELHGAATHLAVVAIPLFALLHLLRRLAIGGAAVAAAEPWALGATVLGIAAAGATGLLVWGQAQTTLRGQAFRLGTLHFWLGIALAALSLAAAVDWWRSRRRHGSGHRPRVVPVLAVLIVLGVAVQGYAGGRMTYEHGVGVDGGGQMARTAVGVAQLDVALATGVPAATAGRTAFSAAGLGCARCHGDDAEGLRGPPLAGGRGPEEFRGVHGHGLFPSKVVTDRDYAAIDAYLQTLGPAGPPRG